MIIHIHISSLKKLFLKICSSSIFRGKNKGCHKKKFDEIEQNPDGILLRTQTGYESRPDDTFEAFVRVGYCSRESDLAALENHA